MGKARILVVDDDPDIIDYIEALLEDHGYEVRTARTADEAVRALDLFAAQAVIIDVLMPGRSGLDLLVSLRRDSRYRELAVIMLTGNDAVLADSASSYLAPYPELRGADEVLAKPPDPLELCDALARFVN